MLPSAVASVSFALTPLVRPALRDFIGGVNKASESLINAELLSDSSDSSEPLLSSKSDASSGS
eukprot:4512557-Pleurochrysis_carterae.AAC.1